MTRIDFYILQGQDAGIRPLFACRLAEKAYRQGHAVYINTGSSAQSNYMDQLLWTFSPDSFVPHSVYMPDQDAKPPVLIGHSEDPDTKCDVLLNLDNEIPGFFGQFSRLTEIVDQQSERKQAARKRYKYYMEQGYQINSHEING